MILAAMKNLINRHGTQNLPNQHGKCNDLQENMRSNRLNGGQKMVETLLVEHLFFLVNKHGKVPHSGLGDSCSFG